MTKLSSRERVLTALNHEESDRVPIAMICGNINPPAMRDLDKYLKQTRGTNAQSYIDSFLDVTEISACGEFDEKSDIWGVQRKDVCYGEGSYSEISYYPLNKMSTLEEIQNYAFPKVGQMPISQKIDEIRTIRKRKNTALVLSNVNIFETSWYMRGFEQAMMDMMLQPDLIHYILETVTTFFAEYFFKILKECNDDVDMVFTADDIGQQEGLLLPLDMWEEFIKPYHVRINEMIHNMGVKVIYHTDGAVSEAVPGLIDMGIDILQALQFSASNMDPNHLKDNYGEMLCFEGGMCVQNILPFGKAEEVREETRKLITALGKNGGYLCGPSHFIQAGTPPENIVAFFDEALSYYPFK